MTILSHVPPDVLALAERLRAAGKKSWVVGGCVRDSLLGRKVADWDLATEARPEEVMKIFPRAIPTGIQHGTVTVVHNKVHYEVTTLRGETTYSDGRRPDAVQFVEEITRDLARRDFTINAIALDPTTGVIVDPFDGQKDLASKVIRAVGKPFERFSEDGLRVLRAARFSATLGFQLDAETRAAIRPTLSTYRKVSQERVRDEWLKTMKSATPSVAFEIMKDEGILEVSCPEMLEGVGMEQNKHHAFDVWGHAMACMDACVGDPVLRMAALFHDVGKPRTRAIGEKTNDYTFYDHERVGAEMVEPICTRLKFSNDETARITDLVRHHLFHYSDAWSDAAVRRWIKRVGPNRVEDLYALNRADVLGKGKDASADLAALAALQGHVEKVMAAGAALSVRDLKIDGRVLIQELGLKPGRILGVILEALLEQVITDPAINDREELLRRAKQIAESTPTTP